MRSEMSEEDNQLYADYFDHFGDYLEKNFSSPATVGFHFTQNDC